MDANTSTNEEEAVSNTPNNAPASTPPSRTTETADNVRPIATNSQQQYAFSASIDPAFAGGVSLPSPQPFFMPHHTHPLLQPKTKPTFRR